VDQSLSSLIGAETPRRLIRWSAQRESDEAYIKKIDQMFLAETGFPTDVLYPPRQRSARWRKLHELRDRLLDENPSDFDRINERGESIVWNEIMDDFDPVVDEMPDCTPRSLTDLA
jgi:hypothetical protein